MWVHEVGTDIIQKEMKAPRLVPGHTANKRQSWDYISDSLILQCVLYAHCLSIHITSVNQHNNPERETYHPHFINMESELTHGHLAQEHGLT